MLRRIRRPARLGLAALLASASIAHGACPANRVEIEAGRGDEVAAAGGVDIGIGVHAISHVHINAERKLSTAFQFGEFIGATLDLGRFEIGLRVQHVSNGGIKHPNDGLTYPLLTISRGF